MARDLADRYIDPGPKDVAQAKNVISGSDNERFRLTVAEVLSEEPSAKQPSLASRSCGLRWAVDQGGESHAEDGTTVDMPGLFLLDQHQALIAILLADRDRYATAGPQLLDQRRRDVDGGSGDEDAVEGGLFRPHRASLSAAAFWIGLVNVAAKIEVKTLGVEENDAL